MQDLKVQALNWEGREREIYIVTSPRSSWCPTVRERDIYSDLS